MNRCPITYQACGGRYSAKGLRLLSRSLTKLKKLPFSAQELRHEAAARSDKMSIQGVHPKLSARLNIKKHQFDLVEQDGRYILKPQVAEYLEVSENEDLTMRFARLAGIEVPLHGLLYGRDQGMTYFIRRFDRLGRKSKIHVEDFAQLAELSRDTKYRSSMEKVADLIDTYCTFPAVEKLKLFRLTLFCFLVGNEDMHLKNFSIIYKGDVIALSPAYDLLNTTIVLPRPEEELALPLNGKKNRLRQNDLVDYFGRDRLQLNDRIINKVLTELKQIRKPWEALLDISFLSAVMKEKYLTVLDNRFERLFEYE
ncbi:MAG: HipA domain-containing protein [Thermodesulfobacteriota bacterium]|nr:HipA domain-containing protein [Thermodesulfobacteriota bacterium]